MGRGSCLAIDGKPKRGKDFLFSECDYTKAVQCSWIQEAEGLSTSPMGGLDQDDGTYSGSCVGEPSAVPVVWERPSRPQGGVGVQHFIRIRGTGYLGSAQLWGWLGCLAFESPVALDIYRIT